MQTSLPTISAFLTVCLALGCVDQAAFEGASQETSAEPNGTDEAGAASGGDAGAVDTTDVPTADSSGEAASNADSAQPPPEDGGLGWCEDDCYQMAYEGEEACNGDDACLRRVEERLDNCLELCGFEEEPEPPADACFDRCSELEAMLSEQCNGYDAPESVEQCLSDAEREVRACFERCSGGDDAGCADHCEELRDLADEECPDTPDPAACFEAFDREADACFEQCRDGDRPNRCAEECEAIFEEAERSCAQAEDPEACFEDYHMEAQACFERCDNQGPPPHPDGCMMECESLRAEAEEVCPQHEEPEACFEGFAERIDACFTDCQDVEPWPEPEPMSCDERCSYYWHQSHRLCMEFVGDPVVCEEEANADQALCLAYCEEDAEVDEAECVESDDPLVVVVGTHESEAGEAYAYCTEVDHGCPGIVDGTIVYEDDGSWTLECYCRCDNLDLSECPDIAMVPCADGAEPVWIEGPDGCPYPVCEDR